MMERQFACLALLVALTGCYHSLEIVNREVFRAESVNDDSRKGLKVALAYAPPSDKLAKEASPCEREFLQRVAESLNRQAGYQAFVAESPRTLLSSDVVVRLSEKVMGTSRGSNFIVALPGCVLFTYAWYGFGYDVNWQFQASLSRAGDARAFDEMRMDRKMEVRFTEWKGHEGYDVFGNGYFSSMWYLPPLGTIFAVVNAFVQSGSYYDSTTIALRESGELMALADGVAGEVIRRIRAADVQPRGKKVADAEAQLRQLRDAGVISEEDCRIELENIKKGMEQ